MCEVWGAMTDLQRPLVDSVEVDSGQRGAVVPHHHPVWVQHRHHFEHVVTPQALLERREVCGGGGGGGNTPCQVYVHMLILG